MCNAIHTSTAQLLKVLAHPERLMILDMLREGERCVCAIESALGQRQSYVSQQLSILRRAGLVECRREGWRVFYRIAMPDIFTVIQAAQALSTISASAPAMN